MSGHINGILWLSSEIRLKNIHLRVNCDRKKPLMEIKSRFFISMKVKVTPCSIFSYTDWTSDIHFPSQQVYDDSRMGEKCMMRIVFPVMKYRKEYRYRKRKPCEKARKGVRKCASEIVDIDRRSFYQTRTAFRLTKIMTIGKTRIAGLSSKTLPDVGCGWQESQHILRTRHVWRAICWNSGWPWGRHEEPAPGGALRTRSPSRLILLEYGPVRRPRAMTFEEWIMLFRKCWPPPPKWTVPFSCVTDNFYRRSPKWGTKYWIFLRSSHAEIGWCRA